MKTKNRKILEKRASGTITPFILSQDFLGRFISYCNFRHHYGIIGNIKARKCRKLKCIHYRIFRENEIHETNRK